MTPSTDKSQIMDTIVSTTGKENVYHSIQAVVTVVTEVTVVAVESLGTVVTVITV